VSLPSSIEQPAALHPYLDVMLQHRQGALALDVVFQITQPWTVLFGASGSGKTTVLKAIAGLLTPQRSRIVSHLADEPRILSDSARKVFLPPHLRPVRLGTQAATLFPHKTVRGNVAYGAAQAGPTLVEDALARFGLLERADDLPARLSGGQRQRVSLARAVVAAATLDGQGLLLLDEPFTGLGLAERDRMVLAVTDFLEPTKTPVLSVTHDIGEAFLLAAEVIRIADGRVIEQGPVATVLSAERERLLTQLNG